jgi:2-desacetyl-2-hydroxyethyl bacteriochlorophyllide A dehydrogenase
MDSGDREANDQLEGEGTIEAQALWLAAPRLPELRAEQVPPPGPGQVRLRAVASAISQGTEMLVYRGQAPRELPLDLPTLAGSFNFPIKYGYSMVGEVIDVGPDVEAWRPGDLAFVHHPHQTAFVVPASLPVHLPCLEDPATGVFAANLETAVNVLLDAPLHFGESVLVFGLGTVGTLISLLFKRAGAGRVIAVDPIARRREAALALGIDCALSPGSDLPAQVSALTGGRGADLAVEASGACAALQQAVDAVADEGTVVVVSWYGSKPVTLELGGHFHRGRLRLVSSQVGHINPALAPRWDCERRMALALQLLSELPLDKLISHCIPFDEAAAAYSLVDEHPDRTLQVVLTYDDGRPTTD